MVSTMRNVLMNSYHYCCLLGVYESEEFQMGKKKFFLMRNFEIYLL